MAPLLAQVHQALGQLLGRMRDQGVSTKSHATLEALTEDVLKTSEIEGEHLSPDTVRSSIATRLGIDIGVIAPADRHVDGVVEMILDATRAHHKPLTAQRLTDWHTALFPTEQRSQSEINVGVWRNDAQDPMQVISGASYKRRVHFEAPPAARLPAEIADFLLWFETYQELDPLIKAGLAHLWFVTVHPLDDGNGRIARAIGKCSSDTALRDINDLVERGILRRADTAGRNTSYALT